MRIRPAQIEERELLEDLQRRASLANAEHRAALLAHPDAIALPAGQIERGEVLLAETEGRVAGFVAVLGGEIDGLFVEPDLWGLGIGRALVDAGADLPHLAAAHPLGIGEIRAAVVVAPILG